MRTRGPSHDETRQRILQVARKLVLKHGHGGLSLRAVAREAGFSAPSLYEYFDSKQAIIDAISTAIAASLRVALVRVVERTREPRTTLVELGLGYVAWARKHPQDFMLLFGRIPSKRRSLSTAPAVESPYQIVVTAAEAALGGTRDRVEQAAYAMWATAHGLAMLQLTHLAGFDADFDTIDRVALEALVAGFSR